MAAKDGSKLVARKSPDVFAATEMEGRELACAMLEEFEQLEDADACALEQRYHVGEPQRNTVLRYLDVLRTRNDRALDAGFAAVLSDVLAFTVPAGAMLAASGYRRIIKRSPLQTKPVGDAIGGPARGT